MGSFQFLGKHLHVSHNSRAFSMLQFVIDNSFPRVDVGEVEEVDVNHNITDKKYHQERQGRLLISQLLSYSSRFSLSNPNLDRILQRIPK
jgi:hypothetical protein